MKFIIAIIFPIAVFFIVGLFLKNFVQINRDEILLYTTSLGLISLVISFIYLLKNKQSIVVTVSNGFNVVKSLMETMQSNGISRILLIIVGVVSSTYILYYAFLAFILVLVFIGVIRVH